MNDGAPGLTDVHIAGRRSAEASPLGDGRASGPRRFRGFATIAVLAGGVLLLRATNQVGRWIQEGGTRLNVNAPPLTGNVDPRISPRSFAALGVGAAGVCWGDALAQRLAWRRLLWLSFGVALAWSTSLAFWDGTAGFTRSVLAPVDYLAGLSFVGGSPGSFLRGFVAGIDPLPSHIRAHPPGLVLTLWGMDRVGLGGAGWVAAFEHVVGASAVPAVLMTSKEVAGERFARGAAPFLIFAPTALFWSSGDAVFLGIGAWAVCFVILATGRTDGRGDLLATAGGTLAALGLFSSYGLLLLGLVPLAVAVQRRRVRPILLAALPIVLMLAGAAAAGFWWFDGLAATRREYAESIARVRPYWYFVAANIAALAVALGPATLVALSRLRDRKAWLLVGGALGAVAIADLSGLSKAEVERIWLPFMPWIVVAAGAAFASARPRRGWLGAQIGWTLLVQLVVLSPW